MSKNEQSVYALQFLDGLEYPATRQDIVACAESNGASEKTLDQIQAMPKDSYESLEDVNKSLYKLQSLPGNENLWSSNDSEDLEPTHKDYKSVKVVR